MGLKMRFNVGDKAKYSGMIGIVVNTGYDGNGNYNVDVDFGGKLVKTFINCRGLTSVKEPKKSNLLELDCEQVGDSVKIVAIRNGMAFEDIIEKYGYEVLEIYRKYQVSMCVYADQISMYSGETNTVNVKINESMSAVVHESLMIAMKEAGSNLVKAIKQAKQVKKFTITI